MNLGGFHRINELLRGITVSGYKEIWFMFYIWVYGHYEDRRYGLKRKVNENTFLL